MKSFWQNKRVFVTGHTGFKGGWLSLWLHRLGAHVRGFSLEAPTHPNLFTLAGIGAIIEHQIGDIRDGAALAKAVSGFKPDIVFHLAAQPLLRTSYENPVETYATNVMGTVNMLEAVRRTDSVRATLVITSDKCYESHEGAQTPHLETDPMGGHDPYSSSKGCAELAAAAYGKSYFRHTGQSLASARAGNVIGGGDWAHERLMTDIVAALTGDKELTLRMPHAIRPWQHVLEPLAGYLLAAHYLWEKRPAIAEAWNFGPGSDAEVSVGQIVQLAYAAWGKKSAVPHVAPPPAALHEASYLALDTAKARGQLGWKPLLSLPEAVNMTIEWFKRRQQGEDMQAVTLQQIMAYEQRTGSS